MSTSYEPHTLIVVPEIGTHAVDQRVADYILKLAAENERLRAAAQAVIDDRSGVYRNSKVWAVSRKICDDLRAALEGGGNEPRGT